MIPIMETLEKYKAYAEEQGLIVYAIALKGSQNYNLSDEESDVDANLVFIPSLADLRSGKKYKFEFDTGDVVCHNIYSFAEIVAKGNPQWVEVCNTEYIIGDLSLFSEYTLSPSALKGMIMEKVHAFSRLYPSREKYVKEFGYDPKQLHHIIRLVDTLEKGVKVYKYNDTERLRMLDIKRGRYPGCLWKAQALRDEYVDRLAVQYEAREEAYTPQVVDFKAIDKIVLMEYIMKGIG